MNTGKISRMICWVISIFGALFILVGVLFFVATIINLLPKTPTTEPASPWMLPSITTFFLLIGAGILSFGIMGIRRRKV